MKARPTNSRKNIPLLFAALTLSVTGPVFAQEDVLVVTGGQERRGEVVSVSGPNVVFKIGPAQTNIALESIESATVKEPAGVATARQALADNNPAKTILDLRPITQTFAGLPTDWAQESYAMLGEALVRMNQLEEAQKVFDQFTTLYPDAASMAAVSVASLDIARGDFAAAKEKITPVVTEAASVKLAEPARSANYGRAFLIMGQIKESEGYNAEALEDYLRTVTVFYADAAATADARQRADKLSAEKGTIVP